MNDRRIGPISKSTFINTKDDRHFKSLLFDVLAKLDENVTSQPLLCRQQQEECEEAFSQINKRIDGIKLWNTAAGAASGFLAALGVKIKDFFL